MKVFAAILATTVTCCCGAQDFLHRSLPANVQAAANSRPTTDTGTNAGVVNVVFTVTDHGGRFVKDLQQSQFKVLDNNKPPQKMLSFESQTVVPMRVGLLFDASNSIRDRFLFEQKAAADFVQQVIRPQADKAFVLAFDEILDIKQDFTDDTDKLTAGIKNIHPGGGTAMWDAIYYACRDKLLKERNSGPVRRVIILMSDGDDNQSRVLRKEAVEMAQRAEVSIYTISTNFSSIHDTGDQHLSMLAEATGGRAFFPRKLEEMTDAFKEIQAELRSQYFMSYVPDHFEADGQFRSIQILPENTKLRVRVRKGYFAPKE